MNSSSTAVGRYNRQRTFSEKTYLTHHYYKRTGRYQLIGKYSWKLALTLVLIGLGVGLFNYYVLDVDAIMDAVFSQFSTIGIIAVFFASESLLGLIPPDIFVFWAGSLNHPYLITALLALLSYSGGLISYGIGTRIHNMGNVKNWLEKKYHKQLHAFRKFGGLLIVVASLTPLPFSPLSIIAGMAEYPFKKYAIMATARLVRFFLYAMAFFELMDYL